MKLTHSPSRCGYCRRELIKNKDGFYACKRCAPKLSFLKSGRTLEEALAAYGQFVKEAWKDRER